MVLQVSTSLCEGKGCDACTDPKKLEQSLASLAQLVCKKAAGASNYKGTRYQLLLGAWFGVSRYGLRTAESPRVFVCFELALEKSFWRAGVRSLVIRQRCEKWKAVKTSVRNCFELYSVILFRARFR